MAIYNGTQKIDVSGVDKVYVGTQLVYQKTQPLVTISYKKAFFTGTVPASKQVPVGYALTAADLPTQTDSTTWTTTGWTVNGTNKVSAGYVVNSDITLKAIHKGVITSSNLFKTARKIQYVDDQTSLSTGDISMGTVGNCNSGSTTKTVALKASAYSRSFSGYSDQGYCAVAQGAWGGPVTTMTPACAGRFEWTPTTSSVTFTNPSNHTTANNYTATYPTVVFRRNDNGNHLWHTSQNSTNKISHAIEAPNSGKTNIIYVSYGGNNGSSYSTQLARRTCYREYAISSFSGNVTCNKSTVTETFYFYVT